MRGLKKAYVEITNICNKSCSFCHGTKRSPREMTSAELERVLTQLDGVTKYVYFHLLGEPLTHPHVIPFVHMADSMGFKVTVTTNGSLLTQDILDAPIYKLQISLHSFEEDDENAHKAYLDNITAISHKASEKGILVSLRLWNVKEGVSNAIAEERLASAFPKPWKVGNDGSLTLKNGVYLSYAHPFEWPDMNNALNCEEGFCYGLRDQIGILSDGTVVPCCLDSEGDIPLGNVFDTSLEEILTSPNAIAIYDGFSQRKRVAALCKKCSYALRF